MAFGSRLVLLLMMGACSAVPQASTSSAPAATPEEVSAFCDRVAELGDVSRTELLHGLVDVAPAEIKPAIERAKDRGGGTFEDDELIDEWLERCRS